MFGQITKINKHNKRMIVRPVTKEEEQRKKQSKRGDNRMNALF